MQRLALRWRVIAWIASAHLFVIAAAGAVIVFNARHAVELEIQAAQDSAVAMARSTLSVLAADAHGEAEFLALRERIAQPRHVRILVNHPDLGELNFANPGEEADEPVPEWFEYLITPDFQPKRLEVDFGAARGFIEIHAMPEDEAAEVWEDVRGLFSVWLIATGALLAALVFVIGKGLAPLSRVHEVLRALEAGELSARVGDLSSSDLQPLGTRIDALAQSLENATLERRELAQRLLEQRDNERKEIARELHDELGPCLFAITVETEALRGEASGDQIERTDRIIQAVDAIRAVNRRVLHAVRPVTVGTLPLSDVITDLIAQFKEQTSNVTFHADVAQGLPATSETVDLTVYRILQEGVTNALRHGAPSHIEITARPVPNEPATAIEVCVSDDGRGIGLKLEEGRGVLGMRERVAALGGRLDLAARRDHSTGTRLCARLPVAAA
ncbi:MAG: hypothetical protein JJ902_21980 [Roseibium sp.]|nr:hypothetical protein [Roseibium sp.]